jgi:hypothetical protein
LAGVDASRDIGDIRRLAAEIGVRTFEEAVALVTSFYPRSQLQPKVQFGREEIFSGLANGGNKPA